MEEAHVHLRLPAAPTASTRKRKVGRKKYNLHILGLEVHGLQQQKEKI
jgi:hypothetical protein